MRKELLDPGTGRVHNLRSVEESLSEGSFLSGALLYETSDFRTPAPGFGRKLASDSGKPPSQRANEEVDFTAFLDDIREPGLSNEDLGSQKISFFLTSTWPARPAPGPGRHAWMPSRTTYQSSGKTVSTQGLGMRTGRL